jgi:hypothetical protein
MRDPTVSAAAAAEAERVRDAIEAVRTRLCWVLKSDGADSRWSGQSLEEEWESGFYAGIEAARQIINDPACNSLLWKHARVPGARELITAALERALPRLREKGKLREQKNALRNQYIAEAVAWTCRDDTFSPTRQKESKAINPGCSIVAEALRQLGFKRLGEIYVTKIWNKHKQAYEHLLPR